MLVVQLFPKPLREYLNQISSHLPNKRAGILYFNVWMSSIWVILHSTSVLRFFHYTCISMLISLVLSVIFCKNERMHTHGSQIPKLKHLFTWIAKIISLSSLYLLFILSFYTITFQESPKLSMEHLSDHWLNFELDFAIYAIIIPWISYTTWTCAQLIFWQKTPLNGSMVKGFGLYLPKWMKGALEHNAKVQKDMMASLQLALMLSGGSMMIIYIIKHYFGFTGFSEQPILSAMYLTLALMFFTKGYYARWLQNNSIFKNNVVMVMLLLISVGITLCISVGEVAKLLVNFLPFSFNDAASDLLSKVSITNRMELFLLAVPLVATPWLGGYLTKWAKGYAMLDVILVHVIAILSLLGLSAVAFYLLQGEYSSVFHALLYSKPLWLFGLALIALTAHLTITYWKQACDYKIRHGAFHNIYKYNGEPLYVYVGSIFFIAWMFLLLFNIGGWMYIELKLMSILVWFMVWMVAILIFGIAAKDESILK